MNTPDQHIDTEPGKPGGSLALIGFCVAVLIGFAVMLNHPAKVAEWGARVFGWKTPKDGCIANLKQIDGAVMHWALENKKTATDTYSLTDTTLLSYLQGSVLPRCPLGGKYSAAKTVSSVPDCTVPGHTL